MIGYHLANVHPDRLYRGRLLAAAPKKRKQHDWCQDGIYVWTDLCCAQWWAIARNGQRPRYNWLIAIDLTQLDHEMDTEGADWFEVVREGLTFDFEWEARRITHDVKREHITCVHDLRSGWPAELATEAMILA